jgi:hypothetical protein
MNELFQTEEMISAPTPLETARRKLQCLVERHADLLAQGERGNEGPLWELACKIERAKADVASEEAVILSRP